MCQRTKPIAWSCHLASPAPCLKRVVKARPPSDVWTCVASLQLRLQVVISCRCCCLSPPVALLYLTRAPQLQTVVLVQLSALREASDCNFLKCFFLVLHTEYGQSKVSRKLLRVAAHAQVHRFVIVCTKDGLAVLLQCSHTLCATKSSCFWTPIYADDVPSLCHSEQLNVGSAAYGFIVGYAKFEYPMAYSIQWSWTAELFPGSVAARWAVV